MTPERWQQVGELFARALGEPAEARAAWLAAADVPDDVRREVADLLAAHGGATGFLEVPAAAAMAPTTAAPAEPQLPEGLRPGATLGAYQLIRVLGRGGMGVVFEAEDTRLHRRVALKAVSSHGGGATEERRLRREARAAAALVHPNIATVYALEEIDGRAYIASEYLEGETLRDVVRRGPLPRGEALAAAHALASGLDAAHRAGVVHRDLKPENVIRLADGRVKILDFGLAFLEGDARQLASITRLTQHGLVVGTPGYMSPEQLLGGAVDGRTDQYALGVVLVELVTGVHPFEAPTLAATIARVLAADGIASSSALQALPSDVAAVAQRCTRRSAGDRFPQTSDVVAAIEACQRRDPGAATTARLIASAPSGSGPLTETGRRAPMWWWRFHQAAAAAINWMMVAPAWIVHRDVAPGLPWFLACLAATIVAANVRLHLRFTAAVFPQELPAQRARMRGWIAIADWALILLWAYAGSALMAERREWAVVFFAFAIGAAVAVGMIEPATTRAAFADRPDPAAG
jgi:predicted Ser/Thr protein kinase